MLPTLWFGNASSTPTELTIPEGEQILGRGADADLCLSETFVSTHHARLSWQSGQLKVLDLNSTNGTLVNGVPVVGWTTLTDGDVIEFGGIEAVVALPTEIDLNSMSASYPPPPQHESRLTTGEIPRIVADGRAPGTVDDEGEIPTPTDRHRPDDDPTAALDRVAPVTLPPTPPTGITITDIEAVTDGYGDFDLGVFGSEPDGGPFSGNHPESVRGRGRNRRRVLDDGRSAPDYHRPAPAFSRDGVSPIVIIIAVAFLVVIILAAVFLT